jgi:hypothetical protein
LLLLLPHLLPNVAGNILDNNHPDGDNFSDNMNSIPSSEAGIVGVNTGGTADPMLQGTRYAGVAYDLQLLAVCWC